MYHDSQESGYPPSWSVHECKRQPHPPPRALGSSRCPANEQAQSPPTTLLASADIPARPSQDETRTRHEHKHARTKCNGEPLGKPWSRRHLNLVASPQPPRGLSQYATFLSYARSTGGRPTPSRAMLDSSSNRIDRSCRTHSCVMTKRI